MRQIVATDKMKMLIAALWVVALCVPAWPQLSDLDPVVMQIAVGLDANENQRLDEAEVLVAIGLWTSAQPPPNAEGPISDDAIDTLIRWWILNVPLGTTTGPSPNPPPAVEPQLIEWPIVLVEAQSFYPFPNFVRQGVPQQAEFRADATLRLPDERIQIVMQNDQYGVFVPTDILSDLNGQQAVFEIINAPLAITVARLVVVFGTPLPPVSTTPRAPRIVDVDAPAAVVGDGQPHAVSLQFEDVNGDLAQFKFETIRGPSENDPPQTFELDVRGQTTGELNFGLFCTNPTDDSFTVINRFTIIDDQGMSDSVDVEYACLPA